MRVKALEFDEDEDVSIVYIQIDEPEELVYATDTMGPEGLVFPVILALGPEATAELFHKAGKVTGIDPVYPTSNKFWNGLMVVVDRLIEYSC